MPMQVISISAFNGKFHLHYVFCLKVL